MMKKCSARRLFASFLIFATFGLWIGAPFPAAARPDACRVTPPHPFRHLDVPESLTIDDPIHTPDACPAWRFVGVKRHAGEPCPAPEPAAGGAWSVGPLFAAAPERLPPALRPFCLYQALDARPEVLTDLQARLEKLLRRGQLREVVSGCAAVAPTAPAPDEPASWPLLRDHFLLQAAGQRSGQAAALAEATEGDTAVSDATVRLALLDTQPTGRTARPGSSPHGFTLAQITRQLTCPGADESCAVEVAPRLALPIAQFSWEDPGQTTFDWVEGGYFGTIDQLAQAIWEELEAGREAAVSHLVLNLSVAFVGERFGGLEKRVSRMPAPVRALYRVLEVASCRNALVIAAAGNRLGGPLEEHGPLLPGGWERRSAPSVRQCRKILGVDAPAMAGRSRQHEPLLYAAAGTRSDGSPLVNTRPGSTPPRVAYADHAVVASAAGRPTAVLTGSSVATSVVAAAAAVVWQHRPDLDRRQVMDLVERSGTPLGRHAEVYLGPGAPPIVRRVAVCPALALACMDGCAGVDTRCAEPVHQPPQLSILPPSCRGRHFERALRLDARELAQAAENPALCDSPTIHFDPDLGPPPDPCPQRQYFTIQARPWTGPQPQTDPCVGCEIRPPPPVSYAVPETSEEIAGSGYLLKIDVDPNWPGGALTGAILQVGEAAFALGFDHLEAGDCAVVEGIDEELLRVDDNGTLPPVTLRFKTADGAVDSPVFVAR